MPVSSVQFALAVALALPGNAPAAEALPDAAFIEYLGSWETTDSDWQLFDDDDDEVATDENDRGDPRPEERESREQENER